MLKNKIIFELSTHLCLGNGQNHQKSDLIIQQIFTTLQQSNKLISPTYIIETAVFNIIVPIHHYTIDKQTKIIGNSLKQSIRKGLVVIIKYAKNIKNNQTISNKLTTIFNSLYKKDHILYEQKTLYINKLLNL